MCRSVCVSMLLRFIFSASYCCAALFSCAFNNKFSTQQKAKSIFFRAFQHFYCFLASYAFNRIINHEHNRGQSVDIWNFWWNQILLSDYMCAQKYRAFIQISLKKQLSRLIEWMNDVSGQ